MTVNEAIRQLMQIEAEGHGEVEIAALDTEDEFFSLTYGLNFDVIEIPLEEGDDDTLERLVVLSPPEYMPDDPGRRFKLELVK